MTARPRAPEPSLVELHARDGMATDNRVVVSEVIVKISRGKSSIAQEEPIFLYRSPASGLLGETYL